MRLLIYQRYLIKNITLPLVMISFVITMIMWIIQSLKFLYLIDRGVKIIDFFRIIIFLVPSLLFTLLPFITLFAVIYTYNHLSQENQLIILKNANVSDIKLTMPAIIVGLLVTLAAYFISFYLMPLTYSKLKTNVNFIKENYTSNIINEREFNQVAKDMVLFVDSKGAHGSLKGIVLFDNRNYSKHQGTIIVASKGRLELLNNAPVFELYNGIRYATDVKQNALTKLYFDTLIVELKKNNTDSDDNIAVNNRNSKELYLYELLFDKTKKDRKERNRLKIEGHQRIVWPLYNLILPFLALAIWFKSSYNRQTEFKAMGIIVSLTAIVIFIHFLFQNLAINNIKFIYVTYLHILLVAVGSLILFNIKKI